MRVIPCGYGNPKHRDLIPTLMVNTDTMLVSVCYSQRAALYAWSVVNLTKRYGEQFKWFGASLGNINYKQPEKGIEIADMDTGLSDLLELLWSDKTVLLLCGCGSMEPTKQHPWGCHRRVICDALVEACSQVEIVLPEKILAREQASVQMQEEREALYMRLNNIQPSTADYWHLPVSQQAAIRQGMSRR